MKAPVRVAVTGAAGQIGYSLLFRIATGEMLGRDQPVILQLLELPIDKAQAALKGVMMELEDCAFPLLAGMIGTGDPKVAFKDADIALLVGARPRGPGMERKDLLLENAKIFTEQGKALDAVASRDIKVLVVGNPGEHQRVHRDEVGAVAAEEELHRDAAPRPQPRAVAARREERQGRSATIEKLIVWGNHSPTMYADYRFATVDGKSVKDADQRRELEPQRVPADGRQARRRDHRGARAVVGRVGGQRRDRPRARLDAGHATASG